MAEKKKKKKLSLEERHRQLQDQVEAIPYALDTLQAQGKRRQVFFLKYITGPITRFMKRMMDRQRYKGAEGQKLKQSEQMKRQLERRRQAMQYMQGEMAKQQKRAQKRGGGGKPK